MNDINDDDDPTIIPEADLDDAQGGMKIPNIFSGSDKVIDSFVSVGGKAVSVDARKTGDELSDNLVGFYNKGNKLK